MTTTFPTKEAAIQAGGYYATGSMLTTPREVGEQEMQSAMATVLGEAGVAIAEGFGDKSKKTLTIYEVDGDKGLATFGVGQFRDGWDLWLIGEKGMMRRV